MHAYLYAYMFACMQVGEIAISLEQASILVLGNNLILTMRCPMVAMDRGQLAATLGAYMSMCACVDVLCVCVCVYIYIYTYIYTHTHTHTHTHTLTHTQYCSELVMIC